MTTTPTVVLVHGAFADATSWSGVITELQNHGIPVIAPPNPLRGLASDAAYVASVAAQIDGPVVLVGHSYGGALITVAGVTENVVGLVYVAAYALEEGESLGELQGRYPLSPLVSNLKEWTYPTPGGELARRGHHRPGRLPLNLRRRRPRGRHQGPRRGATPLAAAAFEEKAEAAAWRTKPSWALIAAADEAINPDVERFGARRAGATVVELEGASHAVAVSRPKEVADLIRDAVRATG